MEQDQPTNSGMREAAAMGGLAALVILKLRIPTLAPGSGTCGFKRLVGYDCPGCGLTRGLMALLDGDTTQALQLHPLSPVFLTGILLLTGWGWYDVVRRTTTMQRHITKTIPISIALAVMLILVWSYQLI